jgi:hypothetical protein
MIEKPMIDEQHQKNQTAAVENAGKESHHIRYSNFLYADRTVKKILKMLDAKTTGDRDDEDDWGSNYPKDSVATPKRKGFLGVDLTRDTDMENKPKIRRLTKADLRSSSGPEK